MRWEYNDDYRDQFSKGVHRDILIVPHQTNVIGVKGGPPMITSKVPQCETYNKGKEVRPKKKDGRYVMCQVPWVITNENIVKEKFEYVNSINSSDNLTFSSCESAMVKFTIRNTKTYDEDTGRWVPDIPNLFKYEFYDEETGKIIVGEVQANSVIKVYQYINNDSSTLIYMGMFVVEEDKPVGEGYEREITAYDFLYTLREMDIFNWYKALFDGIDVTENDYKNEIEGKDSNSSSSSSSENQNEEEPSTDDDEPSYDPDDPRWDPTKGGRVPQAEWKLGDALKDLFENLAAMKPKIDSYEKGVSGNLDKYKYADDEGATKDAEQLQIKEDEAYPDGFGMPIMLDPDIFDETKKYKIPKKPGENVYECYGYCPIMELPIRKNSKIYEAKSLSAGKFLEDIGILAGKYPVIRLDKIVDDNYDPDAHYNTYEKCILTFKPLQKNDVTINENNMLTNNDFAKGFKHDYFKCDMIMALNYYKYNDSEDTPFVSYEYLNAKQKEMKRTDPSSIRTFNVTDNTFISYLITDDDKNKISDSMKEKYQAIINLLTKKKSKSILYDGYMKIKYRDYTPYELTTFADPCRDVGDRIEIHFEDKITGERVAFQSYILERKMSGIQNMMDTYTAKGTMANATFSDYKSGTKYSSSSYGIQSFGYSNFGSSTSNSSSKNKEETIVYTGITMSEFCEIIRNIGFRLLDEPTKCKIEFVKGGQDTLDSSEVFYEFFNLDDWDGQRVEIGSSDTHGIRASNVTEPTHEESVPITPGYPVELNWYADVQDEIAPEEYRDNDNYCLYYDLEGKWQVSINDPHRHNDKLNDQGYPYDPEDPTKHWTIEPNNLRYGDTTNKLIVNGEEINIEYGDFMEIYEHLPDDVLPDLRAGSGDYVRASYQYPGIWMDASSGYPGELPSEGTVTIDTPPHVEIYWKDPKDITTWEPVPHDWEGTTVVRKEGSPPLHRWDGVRIGYTKTRDKYKDTPLIDDTVEENKTYYYGIFPYYTDHEVDGHEIRYYRFTKVLKIKTKVKISKPTINSVTVDGTNVTVKYTIPKLKKGNYADLQLYVKAKSIPDSEDDADIVKDLDIAYSQITISALEPNTKYYFVIYAATDTDETMSDSVHCITEGAETWEFEPSDEVQEFTVPKTGVYKLETWGAQGGNATDEEITARGGYGAYSVGEVTLIEGEKLYIAVGKQDGFNGGGKVFNNVEFFTNQFNPSLIVDNWDIANYKESLEYGNPTMQPTMYSEFFLTEWNFNIGNQWAPHTVISNGELVRSGRGDNRSDAIFWIPVNRINKNIVKITADYKVVDQRHWGSGFDRIGFWVAYVDSSNNWHSQPLGDKYPEDENWHNGEWVYSGDALPYIDYIGIEGGDGIYHAKNIILTLS